MTAQSLLILRLQFMKPFFTLIKHLTIVLSLLFITACQTLSPDFDKPEIQVTSIKIAEPENNNNALNLNMLFDIGLYMTNPNSSPLNIRGMTYDITLGNNKVISGISNNIPQIEGYGSAEFTTTASLNLFSSIKFFTDFMQQNNIEVLPYTIKAKIDTGISLLGKVTVTKDGEVKLNSRAE